MKLGYFPGCSLHAMGREADESLRAIAPELDLELGEVNDWACCGATSAHATNHLLSVALPARTLALAEEQGIERILAPCAACFSRLASARHQLAGDSALLERVAKILQRDLSNTVTVINIAQLLRDLVPVIREKTKKPLTDLKVACYYGCLLVRPHEVTGVDDAEAPSSMEEVVSALGATPVSWNRRIDCCGAGMSLARTGSVIRLGRAIVDDARKAGADVIVVGCPMCHSNLDLRQRAMWRESMEPPPPVPVLFLTELVGLGLGLAPSELGLGRHFVSTDGLISRLSAPPPAEQQPPAEGASGQPAGDAPTEVA